MTMTIKKKKQNKGKFNSYKTGKYTRNALTSVAKQYTLLYHHIHKSLNNQRELGTLTGSPKK